MDIHNTRILLHTHAHTDIHKNNKRKKEKKEKGKVQVFISAELFQNRKIKLNSNILFWKI